MDDLKIGVIGSGGRGKLARNAHKPGEGARVVICCDKDSVALDEDRAFYGDTIQTTNQINDVLQSDVDAVFICTPDFLHEEHALAAIAAGKHLYLEKPLAITVDGCDRIISAAQEKGVELYVGHNLRFSPVMRKMRQLIEEGRIGEVQSIWCRHFIAYGGDAYFKDWHSERRYTQGLLLQKAAHDIDVIHWFAGSWTSRVVGMGKLSVYNQLHRRQSADLAPRVVLDRNNWPPAATSGYSPVIDVEDHSMLLLQLENGVQASYQQCHYSPDVYRNYTVIGTEGRIENRGDASTETELASVHLFNKRAGYCDRGNEVFEIPYTGGGHGGADPLIVEDFLRVLRGETPTGAAPIAARMAVATGYFGTESLRNGNVPYIVMPPCSP